jgi:hypothetical protein
MTVDPSAIKCQGPDNGSGNPIAVTGPTGTSAIMVQGTAASGASAVGNPVLIAIKDQVGGGVVIPTTFSGTIDGVGPGGTMAVINFGFAYNGATWDRLRTIDPTADARGPAATGALNTADLLFGYNGVTWDRLRTVDTSADSRGALTAGALSSASYLYGYNGASFDRLRTVDATADGRGAVGSGTLYVADFAFGYIGGNAWDRLRTPNVFKPQSAVNVNAEATIWTPASGKKFRLMGGVLVASVAGNIVLKDNTGGSTIFILSSAAGGNGTFFNLGNGILSATANNVLTATGPAASTLSGTVWGTEE